MKNNKLTEREKQDYLLRHHMAFLIAVVGIPNTGDWTQRKYYGITRNGRKYPGVTSALKLMGIVARKQ